MIRYQRRRAVGLLTVFTSAVLLADGVALAMGGLGYVQPAQAAFSAPKGKIIYVKSGPLGGKELFAINPNGTGRINLTNTPTKCLKSDHTVCFAHDEYYPRWSPDGARVTYTRWDENRGSENIWVMNANGSEQTNLTDHSARASFPSDGYPAWGPYSKKIAFLRQTITGEEIRTMNPDGSRQKTIFAIPYTEGYIDPEPPAWSPDGKQIAFTTEPPTSGQGENWEIRTINADGSGLRKITTNSRADYQPDWSPDGKKIVFVSERGPSDNSSIDIFCVKPDGSGERNLTNAPWTSEDPAYEFAPAWSPEGKKIAFTSYRAGSYDIYTMNADGSGKTQLTDGPAAEIGAVWSPDGKKLVFLRTGANGSTGLYVMNADGTGKVTLDTDVESGEGLPDWQPVP
jgi:TolB protein